MTTKRLKIEKINFGDMVTNLVITITIMITNMARINKLEDSPVVVVSGGSGTTAREENISFNIHSKLMNEKCHNNLCRHPTPKLE